MHLKRYSYVCSFRTDFFTSYMLRLLLFLTRQVCTPMPSETSDWTNQERDLLDELVPFQCKAGHYNQLASLYFTPAETALRQLFHYREYDGSDYVTFQTIPLMLFFFPYFLSSALCSGAYAPTGLFVPLIIGGAAFGRLVRVKCDTIHTYILA